MGRILEMGVCVNHSDNEEVTYRKSDPFLTISSESVMEKHRVMLRRLYLVALPLRGSKESLSPSRSR